MKKRELTDKNHVAYWMFWDNYDHMEIPVLGGIWERLKKAKKLLFEKKVNVFVRTDFLSKTMVVH